MGNLTFEILKTCGIISQTAKWSKELNVMSWGGRAPKYDLRNWDEAHEQMQKGLTFTVAELIALRDLLNTLDLEATVLQASESNSVQHITKPVASKPRSVQAEVAQSLPNLYDLDDLFLD